MEEPLVAFRSYLEEVAKIFREEKERQPYPDRFRVLKRDREIIANSLRSIKTSPVRMQLCRTLLDHVPERYPQVVATRELSEDQRLSWVFEHVYNFLRNSGTLQRIWREEELNSEVVFNDLMEQIRSPEETVEQFFLLDGIEISDPVFAADIRSGLRIISLSFDEAQKKFELDDYALFGSQRVPAEFLTTPFVWLLRSGKRPVGPIHPGIIPFLLLRRTERIPLFAELRPWFLLIDDNCPHFSFGIQVGSSLIRSTNVEILFQGDIAHYARVAVSSHEYQTFQRGVTLDGEEASQMLAALNELYNLVDRIDALPELKRTFDRSLRLYQRAMVLKTDELDPPEDTVEEYFIALVTSLEGVLIGQGESGENVEKFATRGACLLHSEGRLRSDEKEYLAEVYRLRSLLVHGRFLTPAKQAALEKEWNEGILEGKVRSCILLWTSTLSVLNVRSDREMKENLERLLFFPDGRRGLEEFVAGLFRGFDPLVGP